MRNTRYLRRFHRAALLSGLLLGLTPLTAGADTLTDNLLNVTTGTEAAVGDTWLTASFGTGATQYNLDNITLLLANPTPGTAELDLYSDTGLLQPDAFVAALTSPSSYSSSLAPTTFTANGITLDPNATYWVVLKATTGEFDWAWTSDNSGSGLGFQDTWGSSDDAGVTWFTFDTFPTQFSVTASPVPEPGALALVLAGGSLGAGCLLYRRRKRESLPAPLPSPCS